MQLSSIDGSNGFRLDGEAAFDQSGCVVAAAGDINGDGIDDVLIGANGTDVNGFQSGSSYVVFGRPVGGFDSAINLSSLNGGNGFRIDGVTAYDFSGRAISSAGDINGDGVDDLIIGVTGSDPYDGSGRSYVVFGRSAGGFSSAINLSSLDGGNGFRLDGVAPGDASGSAVSAAGDVNGDGIDDLIIGARRASSNGYASGSSFVVFGRSTGSFTSAVNLSTLDGSNGFRLNGVAAHDLSGYALSAAGDINGDGIDDLIIGAFRADSNGGNSGSSFVVFGRAAGGFASAIDLSSLDGSNGFRLDGVAAGDYSGRALSAAGDINGDGVDDLIIGAVHADPNGINSGSSYVLFGRNAGEFDSRINLSSLDGSDGFRLDGVAAYDASGIAVSAAGDFNGDGIDDLVIGAPSADPNGTRSGSSYVIFGRRQAGFPAVTSLATLDRNNGLRLDGVAAGDYSGTSVSAAGDINGDGIDDVIIGAYRASPNASRAGSSYVVFGNRDFIFAAGFGDGD